MNRPTVYYGQKFLKYIVTRYKNMTALSTEQLSKPYDAYSKLSKLSVIVYIMSALNYMLVFFFVFGMTIASPGNSFFFLTNGTDF